MRLGAVSLVVLLTCGSVYPACEAARRRGSRARESARVRGLVLSHEPSEPFDGGLLRPERVTPSKRLRLVSIISRSLQLRRRVF